MGVAVATGVGEGEGTGVGSGAGGTQAASAATSASGASERKVAKVNGVVREAAGRLGISRSIAARMNERKPRPASGRKRIDQLLVDRGEAESRTRAQALVMAGLVFAGPPGKLVRIDKSGQQVADNAMIEVKGRDHPWVGRGGMKLDHAIRHFGLDPKGAVAMDIGSSTGGFTQVLLHHGAAHVFAVDVGTNQLDWKLRGDPRITLLEQTNARALTPAEIDRPCDWVVCDASFIGLAKVLEVPLALAAPRCRLVALIKPQFEVAKGEVGKGGIVRDPALHQRVCDEVREWLESGGWRVDGIVASPITGTEGNVEYLVAALRGG